MNRAANRAPLKAHELCTLHAHEPCSLNGRIRLDCPGGPYFGEPAPGGWMIWHREAKGGTAALMPAPRPSWSREARAAYGARVVANLTQCCPVCGSEHVTIAPTAPRTASGTLAHEPGCPVADDGLSRLVGTEATV